MDKVPRVEEEEDPRRTHTRRDHYPETNYHSTSLSTRCPHAHTNLSHRPPPHRGTVLIGSHDVLKRKETTCGRTARSIALWLPHSVVDASW